MLFSAFVGPAYQTRSPLLDAESLINLYVETVSSSGNQKKANLYGTPGMFPLYQLDPVVQTPTFVCRGCCAVDGRMWAVLGGTLYEVSINAATLTTPISANLLSRGPIVDDGLPVTFASNGRGGEQLAICGGGQVKILDLRTNILSGSIPLPLTNLPTMIDFLDGYFLLAEKDSIRVWFSKLEDGTSWNALDFFARSNVIDNVIGIKVLRDKVWVHGSLTTTIYYDSGDPLTPFLPYPGSTMQEGLVSPFAVGVQGDFIIWMAKNAEGQNKIVTAQAYTPTRISTPALEAALASYLTTEDVELLIYEQEGHKFACFTFPTAGVTWCYDRSESERRGEAIWHQRDTWDQATAVSGVWRARGVASVPAGMIVGDRASAVLYALDLNTFTDAHGPIRRTRRAPYLSAENQWLFLDQVELGMQAGVGLNAGQGSEPRVMLKISRDGARTWDPPMTASIGAQGAYTPLAIWYQCGRVRADLLVLEVTQSDPVRTVWGPGLSLRTTPGSGMR